MSFKVLWWLWCGLKVINEWINVGIVVLGEFQCEPLLQMPFTLDISRTQKIYRSWTWSTFVKYLPEILRTPRNNDKYSFLIIYIFSASYNIYKKKNKSKSPQILILWYWCVILKYCVNRICPISDIRSLFTHS